MSGPPEPPEHLIEGLEGRLGHRFESRELILRALTHPSFANEFTEAVNNQRLEFLGDAVLNTVISTALFERFPERHEGQLSRLRSFLVCEESLAERAAALELGPCIRLGKGERKSGGRHKASLLADAYEAVLAAVYLDGGFERATAVIRAGFENTLEDIQGGTHSRDYKTRLQEQIQSRQGDARPRYAITDIQGPPHARRFTATVKVDDEILGQGQGMSKKAAQQAAARNALEADRLPPDAGLSSG